ncbi:helix-turn-helix transcriptional regulator [Rhodomicrobium sp. Az07]|uniref:helix-turn-helix transcriptional regulator n=1 Tax=Rhodomicrobium sp. Az07 TaxID=2839034 RepID=UPI001BE89F2C|nr:helix-turn-helix transcriptional regulator [Rhodomicrobium sp. Az07]MBT3069403.1 helix-turn-helix transcriptional regulator [Rhodomicrobium sp. Az07]
MVDSFETLIDLIYEAAEDPLKWQRVLAHLTAAVGGSGAAFHASEADNSGFSFGTCWQIDPEGQREYADYYHTVNPLAVALATVPAGVAVPDQALVPREAYKNSELIHDYSRRFDIRGSITLLAARNEQRLACLGVIRPYRSELFEAHEVAFVQRAAPHLTRALALNRRLAQLDGEKRTFEQVLDRLGHAVIVLSEDRKVCYENDAARRLFRTGDALRVVQKRLAAASPIIDARLAEGVRAALALKRRRGDTIMVPRENGARPLIVRIMPFDQNSGFPLGTGTRAIVLISDQASTAENKANEMMNAFGLTPAEKRLVHELLAGRTLRESAESLAITRATSRNRLAHIMSKTGTHRQSELIQLVLRGSAESEV